MKSHLNHVAFLVAELEEVSLAADIQRGEIESFPSEGTRELYVGAESQTGLLLLMQAIGEGPYKHALEKRGPGLHHIALDVEDLDAFLNLVDGWFVHPRSLPLYRDRRVVFLCRPGVPILIEVQEGNAPTEDTTSFISKVVVPFGDARLVQSLGCERLEDGPEVGVVLENGEFDALGL